MSIAQREAERALETRETERAAGALVAQHELHRARAKAARSVVEKNRAVAHTSMISRVSMLQPNIRTHPRMDAALEVLQLVGVELRRVIHPGMDHVVRLE